MIPEDCKPGEYLNVDKCLPCEPGFVCMIHTSEKYPLFPKKEGGEQCSEGHYCPSGTTEQGEYPCPAGTYRIDK